MEDLREIRRRLAVIQTTGQVTKTMRTIAATNLKRAEPRVGKAEEYARGLVEIMNRVTGQVTGRWGIAGLLRNEPGPSTPCYLVITSDKGLAGGYAINVVEAALDHYREVLAQGVPPNAGTPLAVPIGVKGARMLRRRGWRILGPGFDAPDRPEVTAAESVARYILEVYQEGEAGIIFMAYTRFVSTGARNPVVERLLPPESPEGKGQDGEEPGGGSAPDKGPSNGPSKMPSALTIFEPAPRSLARRAILEYLVARIFSAMVHAKASEFAARLLAMESASDSAEEMAKELSFLYHRARQAEITQEISEIITGHESLR
ncbi:MAG TPA: ATP synthase F1 subunit gamma [Firmicutes bacterium]|nr:ATP synthase F1 subunit gamma [Bacillota bacterium]